MGWTIYLDSNGNGNRDAGEASALTDDNGNFVLTGLAIGTYTVAEVTKRAWSQTWPSSGSHSVSIVNGEVVSGVNFGNEPLPGERHGTKVHDLDDDKYRDAGEPALSGWTMYLDLNGSGTLDGDEPATVTDENGDYSFTGLEAGDYTVREIVPYGWAQTKLSGRTTGPFSISISGAHVVAVSGDRLTYTVTVDAGIGDGNLNVDVVDDDTIVDSYGMPMGGVGLGNGVYSAGQSYAIDKTAPVVSSIAAAGSNPSGEASVVFTVTFSEAVTGVSLDDFVLTVDGITGAHVETVTGSGLS